MGCNIHLLVEKKNSKGKWEISKQKCLVNCRFCIGTGERGSIGDKCFGCKGTGKEDSLAYDDRCYFTYSILANVRNGSCSWDGETYVEPISEPRGIPDDYSMNLSDTVNGGYGFDETHSNSYHTLKKLKEYNWDNKIIGGRFDGEKISENVGFFYDKTIPALQNLADECGGDENVRIVFGFDN